MAPDPPLSVSPFLRDRGRAWLSGRTGGNAKLDPGYRSGRCRLAPDLVRRPHDGRAWRLLRPAAHHGRRACGWPRSRRCTSPRMAPSCSTSGSITPAYRPARMRRGGRRLFGFPVPGGAEATVNLAHVVAAVEFAAPAEPPAKRAGCRGRGRRPGSVADSARRPRMRSSGGVSTDAGRSSGAAAALPQSSVAGLSGAADRGDFDGRGHHRRQRRQRRRRRSGGHHGHRPRRPGDRPRRAAIRPAPDPPGRTEPHRRGGRAAARRRRRQLGHRPYHPRRAE